jgi:DNA-binding NtrC family response regulator
MVEQLMADKPLVVCVDDDEAILGAVGRCLRREGAWDVRVSTSPREVLGWISNEQVAVLVSDYEMPEMTGAQLAALAKRIRPETVRVLLTGRRTLETAIDGIHQGEIFRFVGKPFEDRALRQIVEEAVERHQELLELSGDRQRRQRREALRAALEAEYPGISDVPERDRGELAVIEDPWSEAKALGLVGLDREMEE